MSAKITPNPHFPTKVGKGGERWGKTLCSPLPHHHPIGVGGGVGWVFCQTVQVGSGVGKSVQQMTQQEDGRDKRMRVAQYSAQEAKTLEDRYILGYKKEGLWGKGKTPENRPRPDAMLKPSQMFQRQRYRKAKEKTYDMVCQGFTTAGDISKELGTTTSSVRRYLRDLQSEGKVELIEGKEGFQHTWRPATGGSSGR